MEIYKSTVKIPQFIKELMNKNQLENLCKSALEKARLEEPKKTGNLRNSTKFLISEDSVRLYIDPMHYDEERPYYKYLDENHTRCEGYFERATDAFRVYLLEEFNKFYTLLLQAKDNPNSRLAKVLLPNGFYSEIIKEDK